MYKLGSLNGEDWGEHTYPRHFFLEEGKQSHPCLVAALQSDAMGLFEKLALLLKPPYAILYILHTPRGEGEAGRYQSPWLKASELCHLLHKYVSLLTTDSRFDLWIHSKTNSATLVWNRHNVLYAYGPLETFADILTSDGYVPDEVRVPVPHQHHYRLENDADAAAWLEETDWTWSELRPEDEQ